jgi:P-type E1-E2 ATPase
MGTLAVSSSGRALVVGTRALLLESRISVASAETRITELETLGREVLLVALDGDWVGLIALQDRPEPTARGAVHRLLDAGVEPVWLSGDARETSRALARHMGIDHVRPEVLPDDRGREVRRLSQVDGTAAVIGRSGLDDAALAAAPLSVDLEPSGGPLERWDIEIVSGDVRTAAATIGTARQMHLETRRVLFATLLPAGAALLFMLLGAPPWIAPLAPLAGAWLTSWTRQTPAHP